MGETRDSGWYYYSGMFILSTCSSVDESMGRGVSSIEWGDSFSRSNIGSRKCFHFAFFVLPVLFSSLFRVTSIYFVRGSISPTNILYRSDVGPIYLSTSGRHRLSCRSDIGCATQLYVGPMSAAYQTTILVRCRVALHFRIGPTSAFNLGWISVVDTLPTFPNPPFNPCCQ